MGKHEAENTKGKPSALSSTEVIGEREGGARGR
jgi:hypothetical protein